MLFGLVATLLSLAFCAELETLPVFPVWNAIMGCWRDHDSQGLGLVFELLQARAGSNEAAAMPELLLGCPIHAEEERAIEHIQQFCKHKKEIKRQNLKDACWLIIKECYRTHNPHGIVLLHELLQAGAEPKYAKEVPKLLRKCCRDPEQEFAMGHIKALYEHGWQGSDGHLDEDVYLACIHRNLSTFKCLIDLNLNELSRRLPRSSILHCALWPADTPLSDKRAIANYLFEKGARPRFDDWIKFVNEGNVEALKAILEYPEPLGSQDLLKDVLSRILRDQITTSLEMVQLLIKHGGQADGAVSEWVFLLDAVAKKDQPRLLLWLLLERGSAIPRDRHYFGATSRAVIAVAATSRFIRWFYNWYKLPVAAALTDEGTCLFRLPRCLLWRLAELQFHLQVKEYSESSLADLSKYGEVK